MPTARNVLNLKRARLPEVLSVPAEPSQPVVNEDAVVRELTAAVQDAPIAEPVAQQMPEMPTADLAPVRVHPVDAFHRRRAPFHAPSRNEGGGSILSLAPWLIGAGIVVAGLLYISQYGFQIKQRVTQRGSAAVAAILQAKDRLEQMDITGARDAFADAQTQFDAASHELNVFGSTLTGLIVQAPGLGSVRSARNVVNAGQLVSAAGVALGDAGTALSQVSISATAPGAKGLSFADLFSTLTDAFSTAQTNIAKAADIVRSTDTDAIPEEFRSSFSSMASRLPTLQSMVAQGTDLVSFLRLFTGDGQTRRYLILFENSSELRPTGGFAGSYGILTLRDGRIVDWRADDIYNPDGQIKDLIVPPQQLQHITPSWGMRDAAWWADWPTSAAKVAEYWQKGGGTAVTGVIAVHPELLKDILEATGPIAVPGYDAAISADTFLQTLQSQIETDRPTGTPKRIITDLAPIVLDKLASLPAQRWLGLLVKVNDALNRRDILLSFDNTAMQSFADAHGWSGRVTQENGDYLMLVASNVAGAKTDAVTDTSAKLESRMVDDTLVHRLTITRTNNGGHTPYAFYNKTNHTWMRVLVPAGSTLRGITGNARPQYKPMVDYRGAIRDADLVALEATGQLDATRDVITYAESGKTGFGFWMDIPPGQTTTVQLEYAVPASVLADTYTLHVQRQSGLTLTNFEFTLDKPGLMVASSEPALTEWQDSWRWVGTLDRDLHVTATLR